MKATPVTPAQRHGRSRAPWQRWQRFWFRPVSAGGFGMMRVAFGLTCLCTYLMQWHNVERFYSHDGMLPHTLIGAVMRGSWRFSILDWVSPGLVFPLYLLLLACLILVIIGWRTRAALFFSVILLFSFNEYGIITLDGGDTLLRIIGFLLLISPCDRAVSLDALLRRLRIAHDTGKDQDPSERTMPIWPYRLLLWQMVLLYVSASHHKFEGITWSGGSAVSIALHLPDFTRLSPMMADLSVLISPYASWFVLITQTAWVLLLILPLLAWSGVRVFQGLNRGTVKRGLLLAGVLVHGGIVLTMDVGMFSFAVFTAYLGLLLDDDFRAIRATMNQWLNRRKFTVLFDGRCGFCRRSVLVLKSFDFLHRLEFVNLYDKAKREAIAPRVPLARLEQAMHVRTPGGRLYMGFAAFKELSWNLPPLWIVAPLLYLPGVNAIGDAVYAQIAVHRK
jgi:predicted DCC family thiol-disulfide oxidoreductase YuxK